MDLQYLKNMAGFNIYTQDDPDFLTWLHGLWKEAKKPEEATDAIVAEFINHCRGVISNKQIIATEFIDTGLALLLSTGERIPFNKTSTITEPNISVSVMGAANTLASPMVARQVDTSFPITGKGR